MPPLKSIPKLRPLTTIKSTLATIDHRRDREQDPRRRGSRRRSSPSAGSNRPCAHEAWVSEPLEAAEQAEDRARRGDRGQQRDERAEQQHEREALHRRDRDQEQHERGDRRDDVRVENRVEALRVTGRDRGSHGPPAAHFFLDAFEHDDVRVGRDADRQDQPGEARQCERHVEQQDRRVVEERVDREPDDGDEAEEAVQQEQEERDDDEADRGRVPRLGQRLLAERRRDVGALDLREADGQRTGLEDEREVLRLLDRAALAEIDLGVRARDAVRVPLEVDVRRRLQLLVQHDREMLDVVEVVALLAGRPVPERAAGRLLLGDLLELAGAVVRELEQDDRPAVLAEVGARARRARGRRRSSPGSGPSRSAARSGSTSSGSSRCRSTPRCPRRDSRSRLRSARRACAAGPSAPRRPSAPSRRTA